MNKTLIWIITFMAVLGIREAAHAPAAAFTGSEMRRLRVEEMKPESAGEEAAFLARPVFLGVAADDLYVVDAQDCAVKIFSKTGRFKSAFGRKGAGPGEFNFPSGLSVLNGRIYVADKFNRRIQVLDRAGRSLGGFRLPFAPDKVLALSSAAILVTHNPTGRTGPEKMLNIYDGEGHPAWEGLEATASGDSLYDAFRNMILVNAAPGGGFFVTFKSQERTIMHFGHDGRLLSQIRVDERCTFKPMTLPVKGPQKVLLGFCWAGAYDRGRFYFLEPEVVHENDLGPGRTVIVLDEEGRLESTLDLPARVACIAVAADRLYAVDTEDALRIFRIVR